MSKRNRQTPTQRVLALTGEVNQLRKELMEVRRGRDQVQKELSMASARLTDMRGALAGRRLYRHVFVGDAARAVAEEMALLGIPLVAAEPNGVLIEWSGDE